MASERHKGQLSEFLRSCRARLSPAEVGLPDPGRRRTPGLRREDVAALASVSLTWYTWLEQGRDIRVSTDVLERITSALRLTLDEREYLFTLAQHRPAPLTSAPIAEVGAALRRMLGVLSVPALVMTNRWDVVAWNHLITRVFRDYSLLPPGRRNLLRILLTEPEYQLDAVQYEKLARRVVAKFRVDYGQAAGDPAFESLVQELDDASPMFRHLWRRAEAFPGQEPIDVSRHFQIVVRHAQHGGITFEHSSYVPEDNPTLRLFVSVPHDEASASKVARLATAPSPERPDPRPDLAAITASTVQTPI
jgi:transcriptional regulator with XRE-family HTH domain